MHSVSDGALIARINRHLQHAGERVRTCRYTARYFHDLGRHYVVDDRNCLVAKDIDIHEWARELSVADPTEG